MRLDALAWEAVVPSKTVQREEALVACPILGRSRHAFRVRIIDPHVDALVELERKPSREGALAGLPAYTASNAESRISHSTRRECAEQGTRRWRGSQAYVTSVEPVLKVLGTIAGRVYWLVEHVRQRLRFDSSVVAIL